MKKTFFETDSEGKLLEIDLETGKVVGKEKSLSDFLVKEEPANKGIVGIRTKYVYTESFANIICQKIAEGATMSDIVKMKGFPSKGVLSLWRAEHKEFDDALKLARKMRAEGYADMVAEDISSKDVIHKDSVPGERLKFDKLKWLAASNDPETYGQKQRVDSPGGGVQIVIDTGINRGEDGKVVDISKEKKDG
jgi:hypothetical protein